jgi:hypothetical protein
MGKPVAVRQSSVAGGEIDPGLYARTDLKRYSDSAKLLRNVISRQEGPGMNRSGLLYKGRAKVHADLTLGRGRLYGFVFASGTLAYNFVLEFLPGTIRVWKNGVQVLSAGVPVEIATPYVAEDIPRLKFTQIGQRLTIFCKQKTTRELTWLSDESWTLAEFQIVRAIAPPVGAAVDVAPPATATQAAKLWRVVVTAVKEGTKEESLPSAYAEATMAISANTPATYSWDAVAGASEYNIYRGRNGKFGYVGTAVGTTIFHDDGQYPVYAESPPANRNPFPGADDMPQCGTYHDQRLAVGNAWNNPGEVEMSRMGEHHNFDRASPPKATDAVTLNVSSGQYEEIRNILSYGRGLLVMTNATEQLIGGSEGVITQDDMVFDDQPTHWGSSWLDALKIGPAVVFVQDVGATVRDMIPLDKTRSNDLTLVARHLFNGHEIISWCYAHEPFRQIWAVRSDGALLACTYVKEIEQWAWTRHDTDGDKFESVCSVPEAGENAVYALVQRYVGGQWVRYHERLAPRLGQALADGVFLDSATTYSGPPATSITGLEHLIGRTVYALADGIPRGPFVVTPEGTVTLETPAAKVHVGLRIVVQGHTLGVHSPQVELRPRQKLIKQVFMEVADSMPFKAGQRLTDTLETAHLPDGSPWTAPRTGLVKVNINADWDDAGEVVWEHTDPTPLTILSIIREVDFGGA